RFEMALLAVLDDPNGTFPRFEADARPSPHEGIAARLFAFLDRLEKERVLKIAAELLKCRDRGFGVRDELGENGDQISAEGKLAEFSQGWRERMRRHSRKLRDAYPG